ncbi:permease for cytosine/purines, uracil, thiamine, allantoin-domain-containing protein, partial [Lentinula boryana]
NISAGSDLTSLVPRFINIRRGGYIAAIVGYCILPWKLLASSNGFVSYLSAYSVFLSSIAGVMVRLKVHFARSYYLLFLIHRFTRLQSLRSQSSPFLF